MRLNSFPHFLPSTSVDEILSRPTTIQYHIYHHINHMERMTVCACWLCVCVCVWVHAFKMGFPGNAARERRLHFPSLTHCNVSCKMSNIWLFSEVKCISAPSSSFQLNYLHLSLSHTHIFLRVTGSQLLLYSKYRPISNHTCIWICSLCAHSWTMLASISLMRYSTSFTLFWLQVDIERIHSPPPNKLTV